MTRTPVTTALAPLALPGRLAIEGWIAPRGMTFAQWQQIGIFLGRAERSVYWLIGDWWAAGERWDRQRVRLVRDDPAWHGPSYRLCQDCAWVARRYKPSRRREGLTFQHHREAAALPEPEADRLLDIAEAKGLSTRQLRVVARRIRARAISSDQASAVRDLQKLEQSGRRFATIYADPPWNYCNQTLELATGNHYGKVTVDDLCQLPVQNLRRTRCLSTSVGDQRVFGRTAGTHFCGVGLPIFRIVLRAGEAPTGAGKLLAHRA